MQQLQIPPLAEGEIYIGCIGDAACNLYHVILLPGDNDDATSEDQMAWAKSIGGDLPNRTELAMLYTNFAAKFEENLYWSNSAGYPYATSSRRTWYQSFADGHQDSFPPDMSLRARAVRRVPVQLIHAENNNPATPYSQVMAELARLTKIIDDIKDQANTPA